VATPDEVRSRALVTISSGPTGGVVAAARTAAAGGLGDVVSVDMGGTSYDVCLIRDGRPEVTSNWNWRHRYCIALPMVDVHSIGAGGGSLIRTAKGTMTVGPDSAGSVPGPVCYQRGGTEPTVTDADLILGRLDPQSFWGGRMALDVDGARRALADVGAALDMDAEQAAEAAVTIIDAHMADAVRRVMSLAGADPRELDIVAFGGMGAVHAGRLASTLGMRNVLVPKAAPGFSALGLLTADYLIDDTRTLLGDWRSIDVVKLSELADELRDLADTKLAAAGVAPERRRFEWRLNLVYPGQTFDVAIPIDKVPGEPFTREAVAAAAEELHRRNEEARLIEARSQEPVVRGVRLIATGLVDQPDLIKLHEVAPNGPIGRRRVHTGDAWHDEVPVYDGDALAPGPPLAGPAVIQSRFTTIVLAADDTATVQPNGDVRIDIGRS
jgi:N-methylhydantoinase A